MTSFSKLISRVPAAGPLLLGLLLAGCSAGPRAIPGGATEAGVFFTPQIREARHASGEVFSSQAPEYARRDALVGARPPAAAALYPAAPARRVHTSIEQVRVTATSQGYRVYQQVSETTRSSSYRRRDR